eukprot:TRINITY_DN2982_c0_g1_i1.p1 TRINITY_DN2982_c0_g1~~TRINITY_DN2982_c0_g1_i1.p1  ORF type:complete len:336 (-),score=70.98 TRINITY_DN2982_c0_g1_i1:61-1068(-)
MSNVTRKVKVLIVGGGPAGLTAGIYAARANLKPLVAAGDGRDGSTPGGQLMITTEVENFPGFEDGIQGPELMEKLNNQAKRFGAEIVTKHVVEFQPLKEGGPFFAKLGDEWVEAETVILCNGSAANWLGAEGEEKYRNRGISACATCDGPLPAFRKKHLFVVGGGDSAVEEATFLTRFASRVTIIHRRDKLRASKIMEQRALTNPKIDFLWNTEILNYGGDDKLTEMTLKNNRTGEQWVQKEVGGVFMAIGHSPNTKALVGSGLQLDPQGYIIVGNPKNHHPSEGHMYVYTSVDGVFAAGDVHDKKFKQAISAAGFGCMAAIAAERWLEEKTASL